MQGARLKTTHAQLQSLLGVGSKDTMCRLLEQCPALAKLQPSIVFLRMIKLRVSPSLRFLS